MKDTTILSERQSHTLVIRGNRNRLASSARKLGNNESRLTYSVLSSQFVRSRHETSKQ